MRDGWGIRSIDTLKADSIVQVMVGGERVMLGMAAYAARPNLRDGEIFG